MKKLPLITLLSFFILIPTIKAENCITKDNYKECTKTTNHYYFFLKPYTSTDFTPQKENPTPTYTLSSQYEAWQNTEEKGEITLLETQKEKEECKEDCWDLNEFYTQYIAIENSSNIERIKDNNYAKYINGQYGKYHGHLGWKINISDDAWENTITCNSGNLSECNIPEPEFSESDKTKLINATIKTDNTVELIRTNDSDKPDDYIQVTRKINDNDEFPDSNTSGNKNSSSKKLQAFNGNVYSPILYKVVVEEKTNQCIENTAKVSGKCNETSKIQSTCGKKTINTGNSYANIEINQEAYVTNILTPKTIYQGGGIKFGFIYYNKVSWKFAEDEIIYGKEDDISAAVQEMVISDIANNISVKASFIEGSKKNEINLIKQCNQIGSFTEGETLITTCTFLLPDSEVKLGTGKVKYSTTSNNGINNSYYTNLNYSGDGHIKAELSNLNVLDTKDDWGNNWTLTYDGENDDSCKVNVTSRLYKSDQSNEYAFIYRPIDLNNPFPNRNAGVNWYDWYSISANKERLKTSYSKLEYQVELDNQSVSKIKEYNKNNNYLNWTGIDEETEKSDFVNNYNINRTQEGGNP